MRSLEDLTADRLERLVGGLIFERGREYQDTGRVGPIRTERGPVGTRVIEAEIRGSRTYRSRLSVGRRGTLDQRRARSGQKLLWGNHPVE